MSRKEKVQTANRDNIPHTYYSERGSGYVGIQYTPSAGFFSPKTKTHRRPRQRHNNSVSPDTHLLARTKMALREDQLLGLYIAIPLYFVLLTGAAIWARKRTERLVNDKVTDQVRRHCLRHYLYFNVLMSLCVSQISVVSSDPPINVVNFNVTLITRSALCTFFGRTIVWPGECL